MPGPFRLPLLLHLASGSSQCHRCQCGDNWNLRRLFWWRQTVEQLSVWGTAQSARYCSCCGNGATTTRPSGWTMAAWWWKSSAFHRSERWPASWSGSQMAVFDCITRYCAVPLLDLEYCSPCHCCWTQGSIRAVLPSEWHNSNAHRPPEPAVVRQYRMTLACDASNTGCTHI